MIEMLGRVTQRAAILWRFLIGRRPKGYRLPITEGELIRRHIEMVHGRPMIADSGYGVAIVVAYLVQCGWDVQATKGKLPDLSAGQIRAARAYTERNWGTGVFSIARRRQTFHVLGRVSLSAS